jgi:hypothetical protein
LKARCGEQGQEFAIDNDVLSGNTGEAGYVALQSVTFVTSGGITMDIA